MSTITVHNAGPSQPNPVLQAFYARARVKTTTFVLPDLEIEFPAMEMSGVERDKFDTHRFGKVKAGVGLGSKATDTDKVNALLVCLCMAEVGPDGTYRRIFDAREPTVTFMQKVAEFQQAVPGTVINRIANVLMPFNGIGTKFEEITEKN